jgi:hypothetical protein
MSEHIKEKEDGKENGVYWLVASGVERARHLIEGRM